MTSSSVWLAGLKWRESYNCYSAKVGAFHISFAPSMVRGVSGYVCRVDGKDAEAPAQRDQASAAQICVTALKVRLMDGLRRLEEAEKVAAQGAPALGRRG